RLNASASCDLVHYVKQCTTSEARIQESRPFWLAGEALFTKDIARPCQRTRGGVSAEDLYQDAAAWRGMSAGLLKGFRKWLLEQGFAIGTLNQRLSIIRQYCRLANAAGVLSDETLELVLAVKGYGGKVGRNLDVDRTRRSVPTRKS